ncbi:hypothetical protein [Streptomyces sp. NPDC048191]|uniref:hypothetical protein n=1 Tax=Streptomyces sp. NPDC048191 TaxID=3155484 RepID=UPI0033C545E7
MHSRIDQPPRTLARGSAMVMATLAVLWWLSGAIALGGTVGVAVAVAGPVLGAVFFRLAARRLPGHGEQELYASAAGRFRTTNLVQAGAIAAVIALGNVTGERGWIPGLIAVVVGLHFLPLAGPFARPEYRWVGGLMAALGAAGCGLAVAGAPVSRVLAVVGLGSAAVLWASVVWLLVTADGPPAR